MIEIEENDLLPEIEQELAQLNQEAEKLESDLQSFKNIHDELNLLKSENQTLKNRLEESENKHENFVASYKEVMRERDKALKYLLGELKQLKEKMAGIRGVVNPNTNSH